MTIKVSSSLAAYTLRNRLGARTRLSQCGCFDAGNGFHRRAKVATLEVQGYVHQSNQHGHLDQGPITAAKATPELIPNTATATAMASSKLLLEAVNDKVAVFE